MDSYQRSARNALRAFALNRESERRDDPSWLAQRLRGASLVPVLGDEFPSNTAGDAPLFVDADDGIPAFGIEPDDLVFLGLDRDRAWFAWPAEAAAFERLEADHGGSRRWDLRRAGLLLDASTAGLLAYAKAVCHWHRTSRYCGCCGSVTATRLGGHQRVCTNPDCGLLQFPRLDPAVIVRVTRNDRVLLGRQSNWPARRYSVIAGFVEPGESLEDAVRREVHEETGLALASVHYHSSQPWPFPASLMVGFAAESESSNALAGDELESVLWLDRDELTGLVQDGALWLSPRLSIAYRLLEHWFDAGGRRLAELVDEKGEPVAADAR